MLPSASLPERPLAQLDISGVARRDIAAIIARSLKHFGAEAALRYGALIAQALDDLQSDPMRPGSRARADLPLKDARTYHLGFSRDHGMISGRVKEPRHLVLYRIKPNGVVQIARILYDSRDIKRHVPEELR